MAHRLHTKAFSPCFCTLLPPPLPSKHRVTQDMHFRFQTKMLPRPPLSQHSRDQCAPAIAILKRKDWRFETCGCANLYNQQPNVQTNIQGIIGISWLQESTLAAAKGNVLWSPLGWPSSRTAAFQEQRTESDQRFSDHFSISILRQLMKIDSMADMISTYFIKRCAALKDQFFQESMLCGAGTISPILLFFLKNGAFPCAFTPCFSELLGRSETDISIKLCQPPVCQMVPGFKALPVTFKFLAPMHPLRQLASSNR